MHGGQIPALQAAATRIGMSVDEDARHGRGPAVEARDKIKILHDLLDRGGLGATSKLLLGVGVVNDRLNASSWTSATRTASRTPT